MEALDRAGIETLAPFSFVPGSLDGDLSVEPRMTAVVEAASERRRSPVRQAAGEDCEIQPDSR